MAEAKKLTDSRITALKRRSARYEVWDGEGFGVRVTPHGSKSFVWVYHFEGRPRRMTFGTYPQMTLADARVALSNARKALERGEDPGKRAVEGRQAERDAPTVDELCAEYLERHAKRKKKKRSADEDERQINRDVLPRWRGRKAKDITRRDVVAVLDAVVDRGAPVAANRLQALLSKLFRFAVDRGVVEHSPAEGIGRQHKERPRERALSADEIKAAWQALDRSTMELNLRRAAKLMLATAQRKSEVLGMREREIDRGAGLWTIPSERSKNGLPHVVPLSPLALSIIGEPAADEQNGSESKTEWIFPSTRTGEPYRGPSLDHAVRDLFVPRGRHKQKSGDPPPTKPVLANATLWERRQALEAQGKGKGNPEWDEITKQLEAEHWTPHDLRRTASTRMRELGVTRDDVGLVLNHRDKSVTGRVYDKYDGLEEKRRALALWSRRLEQIIRGDPAGSNVVQMPAAANA
jgi:integrase